MKKATVGLPSAATASTSSFCWPTSSRMDASPMWLSAQASREVDSFVPITSTTASACLATADRLLDARLVLHRIAEDHVVPVPVRSCSVMRVPSA